MDAHTGSSECSAVVYAGGRIQALGLLQQARMQLMRHSRQVPVDEDNT